MSQPVIQPQKPSRHDTGPTGGNHALVRLADCVGSEAATWPHPNMTNIIYLSLVIISLPFPLLLFHSHYFSIFRTLHRQLQCCRLITQHTDLSSLAHNFLPYAR
jgi:hypothetical protein